jgi:tetratricopeptide (TPR) repeat protein
MRYKGSKLSVKEIAGEMNVSYVLEGNVSRSGDNVRIIVRMINGKDERLIWTEDYNKLMTAPNLLEIQREVAQQVAVNMNVVINPEVKKRIEAKSTSNTEAYTLFLQAMTQHLPFEQAEPMLERAIFLDPDYADAYALLAFYWLYHRGGFAGNLERKQVLEKAEPLLEKSLQLDKNSIIAHTTLAALSLYYNWDFNSVEKEYQIMNQLNPSNSDYYTIRIFRDYLLAVGKPHEAFKLVQNAFNLNINSSDLWRSMALTYCYDSQPEKALETIETARKRYPDDPSMLVMSIILFNYEAKFDKTITLFEKSTILEKNITKLIPLNLGNMGIAYYKTGEKTKSEAYLNELLARSKNSAVGSPSFFAAAIYTAMGENDKAIQSLEKAYANHEVEMFFLKMEPLFATLHGDPRFEKILTNIGFK